ncbi:Hypothetical protein A7982_06219 [Minicystis rosea]|nr:Hypothetical protein A7982_06219 [Minicystis rosea]
MWAADDARGDARAARLAEARAWMAKLATWAEHCPASFAHKRDLVAAEIARIEGDPWSAQELYERASEGARAEGLTHAEALAEDLAGRFHLARASRRYARLHLHAAVSAYARWGATAKVDAMRREHGELLAEVDLALSDAQARVARGSSASQPGRHSTR